MTRQETRTNPEEPAVKPKTKPKVKSAPTTPQTECRSRNEPVIEPALKTKGKCKDVMKNESKGSLKTVLREMNSDVKRVAYRIRSYGFFDRPPWIIALTFVLVCTTAAALGALVVIVREMINHETRPINNLAKVDNWYEAKWNGFKYSLTFKADSSLEWHHTSAVDWHKTKALCLARNNSRLVYINDSDEQSFLLTFIYDAATAHEIPIPGQDRKALSFWTGGIVRVDPSIVFYNKWPLKQLMWEGTNKTMTFHHHCKFSPEEVFVEGHTFALMFDLYNDPHRYLGCWMASHPMQKFFPLCKEPL